MRRIDCFIPFESDEQIALTMTSLKSEKEVANVIPIDASTFKSTSSMRLVASRAEAPFVDIHEDDRSEFRVFRPRAFSFDR